MKIPSHGTPEFWQEYHSLPTQVKTLARKNYQLWADNAFHPSLRFKPLTNGAWSVRIGGHYRAIGRHMSDGFLWEWIGTHEEYNKRF